MGQIKIYGNDLNISKNRDRISDAIHSSVVKGLDYPKDKRFHRFIRLTEDDYIYPESRTENYLIIEINMFEGRSVQAKKKLINLLYKNLKQIGINSIDLEITIFETPKCNWGIRGLPGDELNLNYKVEV